MVPVVPVAFAFRVIAHCQFVHLYKSLKHKFQRFMSLNDVPEMVEYISAAAVCVLKLLHYLKERSVVTVFVIVVRHG